MASYTLHLGLDWNGAPIGTFWASGDDHAGTYRFLQYALASATGAPAWFHFTAGDTSSVELWDLTPAPPRDWALALSVALSFSALEATSAQTLDPRTLVSFAGVAAVSNDDAPSQLFLQLSSVNSAPGGSCPWGASAGHYAAGAVTFTSAATYKVSFCVRAAPQGGAEPPRIFVSDPEVIVGSRG